MRLITQIREIQDEMKLGVGPDFLEMAELYAELENVVFLAQRLQEKIAKRKAELQNPIHFAEFE